ncbi:MAG: hypothetical protein ACQCN3_02475 [Candidatus Bathyarchaeia archaeon]|jgi:hypothetical protein
MNQKNKNKVSGIIGFLLTIIGISSLLYWFAIVDSAIQTRNPAALPQVYGYAASILVLLIGLSLLCYYFINRR